MNIKSVWSIYTYLGKAHHIGLKKIGFPAPRFVRILAELATQHNGVGGGTRCSHYQTLMLACLLVLLACLFGSDVQMAFYLFSVTNPWSDFLKNKKKMVRIFFVYLEHYGRWKVWQKLGSLWGFAASYSWNVVIYLRSSLMHIHSDSF